MAAQALLDLCPTTAQDRLALLDPGGPHLQVPPEGADRRHPLVQPPPGGAHGHGPLRPRRLLGRELREDGLQLGDPRLLPAGPLGQLGQVRLDLGDLDADVVAFGGQRVDGVGRRRQPGVIGVQHPGRNPDNDIGHRLLFLYKSIL